MVKLALAVVAAVLLHAVASQPLRLEVEIKPKVSNGPEELDLEPTGPTGQEKSEQPLSSGSMPLDLEGHTKPKNIKSQRSISGSFDPFGGWFKH